MKIKIRRIEGDGNHAPVVYEIELDDQAIKGWLDYLVAQNAYHARRF